jgi:hypothetical protein
MPPAALRRMNTARMVYVPKTTGVRPIAIQETVLRLLLRCLNAKYAKVVGDALAPIQVAVGISGGTEKMAEITRHAF